MSKKKPTKKKATKARIECRRFDPSDLDWTIIARPLQMDLEKLKDGDFVDVVIDLNFKFEGGLTEAKERTVDLIVKVARDIQAKPSVRRVDKTKKELSEQYLFAHLEKRLVQELAKRSYYDDDGEPKPFIKRPVFMIWPDFDVRALTLKSISTIKADAAHRAFSAGGDDIVWAVLDSGVDGDHPHFARNHNLAVETLDPPLKHRDFTPPPADIAELDEVLRAKLDSLASDEAKLRIDEQHRAGNIDKLNRVVNEIYKVEAEILALEKKAALTDELGHGTHVAGIIAGEMHADFLPANAPCSGSDNTKTGQPERQLLRGGSRRRNEFGDVRYKTFEFERISGVAPRCKILSIKVLDKDGKGPVSNLLAAIAEIQKINEHGRWLKIHGVNLSVGYDFEPEWFACGRSPLCVEVDRLVKSGVVVVAAAGNTGYGYKDSASSRGVVASGMMMSINDPGNADLAITVGSTHREMPHMYGVSFFSSKGPTGDGRLKPDLVAPGERIVSCSAGRKKVEAKDKLKGEPVPEYEEDSGTSMAAPHVSGAIAAFLSIRREFIGKPEQVKEIFLSNATDLKRERYLQGSGLVDLMRSIQSV